MDRRTLIDKLDALANGTLASDEAERLRERCAADPELRAFLADYLEVHAMTECLSDAPPPCRLTFAEVEDAAASRRPWRVVLRRSLRIAAAVLVLVAGGLVLSRVVKDALRGDPGTGRSANAVALRAVPLVPEEVPASDLGTPEMLGSYRPVADGEIRWIDSFDTARAVAKLSSRPVLLYIYHPTCPWCLQMNAETFTDPDVLAGLTDFVPAKLNVMTLDERLRPLLEEGWPWLGAVDANGTTLLAFPGLQGAGDLKAKLDESVRRAGPAVASWERVNDVSGRFAAAVLAEEGNRLAFAFEAYAALAGDEAAGPFADAARAGRRRIEQAALRTILTARELSRDESGVKAAIAVLEFERDRLAGTALATDLAAVIESLSRTGRFPELTVETEDSGGK